jgi:hypothetical protein
VFEVRSAGTFPLESVGGFWLGSIWRAEQIESKKLLLGRR